MRSIHWPFWGLKMKICILRLNIYQVVRNCCSIIVMLAKMAYQLVQLFYSLCSNKFKILFKW